MRCRSQAEMDQLIERAGFKKVTMRIDRDRFGVFTVSLAIKQSQQVTQENNSIKKKQENRVYD